MSEQRSVIMKKVGTAMLFTNLMMGFALTMSQNYAAYSYTDLAGISTAMMGTCMFIVNSIAIVVTLISGAIVSSTRTKWGKFRPWIVFANAICLIGGFLIFFNVGNSILLKAVIISIGYLFANSMMDFVYTARIGIISNVGGADSDLRNHLVSRQWMGCNICYIIGGFAVVPLVAALGSGNETRGFLLTQLIFTIIVMAGAIWFFRATADYDKDNRNEAHEEAERVPFIEMIKAVLTNRLALAVVISDILRFTGYYVLMNLMIYQCTYVIGDMRAMSYVLSSASFCAFFGNLLAPRLAPKFGGRKRTIAIFGLLTGLAFCSIALLGRTTWGFIISCGLAFFLMSFIDTLDAMLYTDAGEYWLHEKGKDTRPYLVSMYNVAVKIAVAISALVLAGLLGAMNYQPGAELSEAGMRTMTIMTGLAPGIGYLLPVLVMMLHNVSDKEMEKIISDNAEMTKEGEA